MKSLHRPLLMFNRSLAIFLFSVGMLTACVSIRDTGYPDNWAPRRQGSTNQCPAMAGTYLNQGERVPKGGTDCFTACGGLIDELDVGSMFRPFTPLRDKRAKERIIEILQPANSILDVVAWKDVDGERKEMARLHLSADHGDFHCENGEMRLAPRIHAATVILVDFVAPETRVFSKASDGALIMKRTTSLVGHVLVVPMVVSSGEWIRWPATELSQDLCFKSLPVQVRQ